MSNLQTPFRYDFVGSFLRPQALKDAKAAYQAGEISKEAFDRVAEEEVAKVVPTWNRSRSRQSRRFHKAKPPSLRWKRSPRKPVKNGKRWKNC